MLVIDVLDQKGLSFAQAHGPMNIEEALEITNIVFDFVTKVTNRFDFWFEILKRCVLPPMYPRICARLLLSEGK